jgi:hypothetical protein
MMIVTLTQTDQKYKDYFFISYVYRLNIIKRFINIKDLFFSMKCVK